VSLGERYKQWRQARKARAEDKLERNLNGVPLRESIRASQSKVIDRVGRPVGPLGGPRR
jgi:hypothetical protein